MTTQQAKAMDPSTRSAAVAKLTDELQAMAQRMEELIAQDFD